MVKYSILLLALIAAGCAAHVPDEMPGLHQDIQSVYLTKSSPASGCQYIGLITQGYDKGYGVSNRETQCGAFNVLLNRAYHQGANFIELHMANPRPDYRRVEKEKDNEEDETEYEWVEDGIKNVILSGSIYYCPSL